MPTFVVTHTVSQEWVYGGSPFTFVTDGVESAVEQAKAVAGDKNVAVGAASLVQQCIKAGLLDEVNVNLVPVLLGRGVRLFAVNVACLDDATEEELAEAPVVYEDGRNDRWDQAPAEMRYL